MTQLIHEPEELRRICEEARRAGRTVGLVPTMGALHNGHLSLIDEAKAQGADFLVATIFVNPLQFGEGEDLDRYPRTLAADVEGCRARGVDVVFAPASDAMYPAGYQTHVNVGPLTEDFEGGHRPGHFQGVTTVVTKLFVLVGECIAVFGQKDYQQWQIIRRMTLDLGLPVKVVGHPIVREADGLALSSRNRYLQGDERSRAVAISRGLQAAAASWEGGERNAEALLSLVREPIAENFDSIDYVAIADPDTLERSIGEVGKAVLLVAATVGKTRLLDNLVLRTSG